MVESYFRSCLLCKPSVVLNLEFSASVPFISHLVPVYLLMFCFWLTPKLPRCQKHLLQTLRDHFEKSILLLPARKVENSGIFLIVVTFENNLHGLLFDTYRMYTLSQDFFFRETVRKPVECLFYSFIIVVIIIFKPQSVLLSSSCLYPILQDKRSKCQLHRIGNDQPASLFSVLSVVPLSFVPPPPVSLVYVV